MNRFEPELPPPLVHQVAALERTALAWERTALSVAALGTLLVKLPGLGPISRGAGLLLVAFAIGWVLLVIPIGYVQGRRMAVAGTALPEQDRLRARVIWATAGAVGLAGSAVVVDQLVSSLG